MSESNIINNYAIILEVDSTIVTDTSIKLSWSWSLHNDLSSFSSYQVGRSEKLYENYTIVETITKWEINYYTDMSIDSGRVYYYKIYEYFINENGIIKPDSSNVIKREP